MTTIEGFALANFGFAAFDGWLTQRRMTDYGPDVELNGLIVKLSKLFNPQVAAFLVCILFASAQSVLFFQLGWLAPLAFLTGFRFKLFIGQIQSLFFEARLKEFQELINKKNKIEGGEVRTLSPHSDSQES